MTRGADRLPVTDHAVLRYLQRVCGVDVDQVRRLIEADTETARQHQARGARVNGVVYRLNNGYVVSCVVDDLLAVRQQHAAAAKKILRKSRKVPLCGEE